MGFTVVDEFVVVRDGKAVHHRKVGAVVELSAVEAATLVAAGKVVAEGIADLPTGTPLEDILRDVETGREVFFAPRIDAGFTVPVVVDDEGSAEGSASESESKPRRRGSSGD